jgi:hypothetical protein
LATIKIQIEKRIQRHALINLGRKNPKRLKKNLTNYMWSGMKLASKHNTA